MGRSKFFLMAAFCCLFCIVVGVGAFFIGKRASISESTPQYLLTQDVPRGHSIAGKYEEVLIPATASISSDNLITSQSQLEDAVAAVDLYKHSPLTKSSLTTLQDYQRNIVKSLPITVETSIANSISVGDHVAVMLKYNNNNNGGNVGKDLSVDEKNKNTAVVLSDVTITQLKSSSGEALKESGSAPGFAVFSVTPAELNNIDTASAEGTLYLIKYNDVSQPRLVENYTKGEAAPKVPTDGTDNATPDTNASNASIPDKTK